MHQARGYCPGCYNFVFHLEVTKASNFRRAHNIDYNTYKEITKKCIICGFDKTVDLHHLDGNHKNNSKENMVGLCPNHHKMIHNFEYRDEIQQQIKKKLIEKREQKTIFQILRFKKREEFLTQIQEALADDKSLPLSSDDEDLLPQIITIPINRKLNSAALVKFRR